MAASNRSISIATIAQPSKFSAAGLAAFTVEWCYAKITPAALHCGEIGGGAEKNAEAVGCGPKFRSIDFDASPLGWRGGSRQREIWHQVKQNMPAA
jgi:hypothetical protein